MNNLIIKINATIKDALQLLEINTKRFLVLVDINNYLIGVVTDGDIRRSLLNGYILDDNIINATNKQSDFVTIDSDFNEVCEKFQYAKNDFLPILESHKVVNIITKKQFYIMLLEGINFNLKNNFSQYDNQILEHNIYNKPWGFYKSTILSKYEQSKIITLFPDSELSLQEHKKREEHWVIVKGIGTVILGESELDVYPGKYIYIPKGCKHKIINTNKKDNLIFSEVQLGDYFGEDDIIRYSDKYGRVK